MQALQKTVAYLPGEGSSSPTSLYTPVVTTCREIFGAQAVSLYLESGDGVRLTMVAGDRYSKVLVDQATYEPREGITGHVWSNGDTVKIHDEGALKEHPHHAGEFDPRRWSGNARCGSLLTVPLKIGGHVIGVLTVENQEPGLASFALGEQRVLEMITLHDDLPRSLHQA
jgi:transcriptional regulator with GAF, ATPase, and Fis domain